MASSPDWNAALYDSAASFVSASSVDLVAILAPRSGERILDLGCGTGTLAAQIAAAGATVTGVDASPEMIARARAGHPALDFRVADAQALPFDAAFEAVFSNAALHWMARADDVAAGIARALVPGGRLVLEMGGRDNVAAVRRAIAAALDAARLQATGMPAWYFPSVGEYASLLERHQLRVTWARLFDRPTTVTDTPAQTGLATWLEIFAPALLSSMADEVRRAFMRDVEERCRPTLFRDGAWELDYVRLRMVAEKR